MAIYIHAYIHTYVERQAPKVLVVTEHFFAYASIAPSL